MSQTQRRLDYRATGKLKHVVGIGGMYCACCTLGPKPVTKHYWNRLNRRRSERELASEILSEDYIMEITLSNGKSVFWRFPKSLGWLKG